MKLFARPELALIGGGIFALAVAIAVAHTALAAGIGMPGRAASHIASETSLGTLGHRGPFGGSDVIAAAATYIGVTEAQLRTELEAGKSLAEVAVANGKTRDGLIAALSKAASDAIPALVDQKGVAGPGGRPGHVAKSDSLAVASAYLGIPQADLATRVHAGETLAAIAGATAGRDRAGLIAALVADANAKVDAALAAGTITAEQATRAKANATDHATRAVDSTRGPGGPGRHGRR
jgi:hypothetical protein